MARSVSDIHFEVRYNEFSRLQSSGFFSPHFHQASCLLPFPFFSHFGN
jgi:hypothetical protein